MVTEHPLWIKINILSNDRGWKKMVPLFKPYMPELPDLNKILYSENLASGEYTKAFESALKDYFQTQYVLVVNSFNLAIFVTVTSLGLTFNDEILASPMSCLASSQPYLAAGMKIKWCDIDPSRGTLSPDAVRKTISSETKAIVHNHFCGYPGYIDDVNAIGKEFGIPVIDDGIECFGSEYKGKKVGCCGTDATVFSLTAVRLPHTIDGGVIIFKNKEHYKKALRIRDCGIDRSSFRDELGEICAKCDISEIGYSATMSNVNAYIGLQQMPQLAKLLLCQRENAQKWNIQLHTCRDIIPIRVNDAMPNYWIYGVRADNKRETIKKFREKGFYASGVHINNNIYSAFGEKTELAGVNEFYSHFVAIPCGWWMGERI